VRGSCPREHAMSIDSIDTILQYNTTISMAESSFVTRQYASEQFVESCGAVLFMSSELANAKVCLINLLSTNEWMLPKGRRNIGESRKEAAVREVAEETGLQCRLLPVTMSTRACAANDPPDVPDEARTQIDITEPFMCTIRELAKSNGTKLIWWYIAVLEHDAYSRKGPGEAQFKSELFTADDALQKLHYESDRELLRKAVEIIKTTETWQKRSSFLNP
jgi:8-oxo-dGTP pyrophosphatase MutT (NUDIX family)